MRMSTFIISCMFGIAAFQMSTAVIENSTVMWFTTFTVFCLVTCNMCSQMTIRRMNPDL